MRRKGEKGFLPDKDKDKERNKEMHATTTKNGQYVSLFANLDVEKGIAKYEVTTTYGGHYEKHVFTDFGKAAEMYRDLSDKIENAKEVA